MVARFAVYDARMIITYHTVECAGFVGSKLRAVPD